MLLNKSLQEGVFSDVLKTSVVIPVFKSGDKSETANYSPISLLSVISKVLDKILKEIVDISYKICLKIISDQFPIFSTLCSFTHAI